MALDIPQIWYRSTLYSGRTYSIHLKCTDLELSKQFPNHGVLVSEDELPRISYAFDLMNEAMLDAIVTRVIRAIEPRFDELLTANNSNYLKVNEKLLGYASDAYQFKNIFCNESYVNYLRVRLRTNLCITPDVRTEKTFDEVLHIGRVTGKQVMLPLATYELRIKSKEDPRRQHIKELHQCNPTDTGSITIYRTIDNQGNLINAQGFNCSTRMKDHDHSLSMRDLWRTGKPVYVDSWSCIVVQIEGLTRVSIKFNRTTKKAKYSEFTKRIPNAPAKRPRKLEYSCFARMRQMAVNVLGLKIITSNKKKLPPWLNISFRTILPIHYQGKAVWDSLESIENGAGGVLAAWDFLSKKQKKQTLQAIRDSNLYEFNLQPNLIGWEKHEHEWVKRIYNEIVLPCSKLKPRRKSESSSNANSDDCSSSSRSSNQPGADDRQATGIILRTARGNESFSCGEPSAEDAGGSTNECDQSSEENGIAEDGEVIVSLKVGHGTRDF